MLKFRFLNLRCLARSCDYNCFNSILRGGNIEKPWITGKEQAHESMALCFYCLSLGEKIGLEAM